MGVSHITLVFVICNVLLCSFILYRLLANKCPQNILSKNEEKKRIEYIKKMIDNFQIIVHLALVANDIVGVGHEAVEKKFRQVAEEFLEDSPSICPNKFWPIACIVHFLCKKIREGKSPIHFLDRLKLTNFADAKYVPQEAYATEYSCFVLVIANEEESETRSYTKGAVLRLSEALLKNKKWI